MHRTHESICKSKKQKESDAVATLVASCCRKLISSNLCRGMECKEPIKLFISSRNKKGVLPWQQVCRKTSQLSSMHGFGMQRTHKNIYTQVKARFCQKISQLQSVLGLGMQRRTFKIFIYR